MSPAPHPDRAGEVGEVAEREGDDGVAGWLGDDGLGDGRAGAE
jgi:hypothetical protein